MADAQAVGSLTLTLYRGVDRIDIEATIQKPAAGPAYLLLPFGTDVERYRLEEAFHDRAVAAATAGDWGHLRGGFTVEDSRGSVAVAAPGALVWLTRSPSVLLRRDGSLAISLTARPRIVQRWSPHPFYRSIETPLELRPIEGSGPAGSSLRRSLLKAQPPSVEVFLGRLDPRHPRRVPLLVRNPTPDSRKQQIVFPEVARYVQFPLKPHQHLRIDVGVASVSEEK